VTAVSLVRTGGSSLREIARIVARVVYTLAATARGHALGRVFAALGTLRSPNERKESRVSLAHLAPLLAPLPVPGTRLSPGDYVQSSDLPATLRPVALAAQAVRSERPMLVITARQETADAVCHGLAQLLPLAQQPVVWAAADPLPYEQMPHDPGLSARRSAVLGRLIARDDAAPVVVTTVRALMSTVRSRASFERDIVRLRVGQRVDDRGLVRDLVEAGYVVEPLVDGPGTVSRRGGILDIYTPGPDEAVRIEFFGDEIDSIRRFDPTTQRSTERIGTVTILPPLEFDLSAREAGLAALRTFDAAGLRDEVRDEWQRMLGLLEAGGVPASIDLIASVLPGNAATLLDYLPTETTIVRLDPPAIELQADQIALQAEDVRRTLELAAEIPHGFQRPYATWETLARNCATFACWDLGGIQESEWVDDPLAAAFGAVPAFAGRIGDVAASVQLHVENDWRVVFATDQSERLRDLLEEHEVYPRMLKRGGATAADPPPPGAVEVIHAPLASGFSVPASRLLVLTDFEVFGLRKVARPPATQRRRRMTPLRQFTPGAYVVHVEHGVGQYQGLVSLILSGTDREYLQVDYADGDRLYVPVDQADRLTPYESPAGTPRVTRLSSPEWAKVKARVRRAVREMAWELIQMYAAREVAQGHAFPPDSVWDVELEESFPFRETQDQLKAIAEVKADMEAPRPMDRLVCGDVGYGKTEVALRAAFKAVNDGMQVAVLVPTTILALQHYNTFRERLAAFPVRVEMLSRLRSRQEQAQVTAGLVSGAVDIVIGTHRLLQKDVSFRNLGLLVVDEEQRFGVSHKEHIKRLRTEVDVLTMTATPIPRTLHMALAGVRDLSLITTPPQDRVPTRTFVTPANDALVREAILREMARGGQVYVVHNRVQSIYRLCDELERLVPEARFAVAHGQMNEGELEQVVLAFIRNEYDVLVCTTIIESGVDIPNANTIILDNAHHLGLTQMYQLRGRVGRSTQRAYAYLLYPANTPLSQEALERLEAIQEATELGAGFQVALRDMEIRGAGNILGAEQSGHIAAVGFDLYTRMLAHAVEEIRAGHPIAEPEEVAIDIALDAGIPEEYVADEQVRLDVYRQISAAPNERALRELDAALRDRFGPVPDRVYPLFDLVRLRHRSRRLGLNSIVERDGDIIVRPVLGPRLDERDLRAQLGPGVRVTPNQVRLRVAELRVDRWTAVTALLDAIAARRASLAVHESESDSEEGPSASSSSMMARARSA
jgi:transcription-repair coupling factor (superfamily II helicase)